MSNIRLTKEFRFEMAHTLDGYDGACSQIHGHSYRLFVTVEGRPVDCKGNPKDGMMVDFGIIKHIVSEQIVAPLDHSFVIRRTEDNTDLIEVLLRHYTNIHVVDYQPTSENMLLDFASRLTRAFPEGVRLAAMKLYETATSSAEWVADVK